MGWLYYQFTFNIFTEGPLFVEFSNFFKFVEYLSADLWTESYGAFPEGWCLIHSDNMPWGDLSSGHLLKKEQWKPVSYLFISIGRKGGSVIFFSPPSCFYFFASWLSSFTKLHSGPTWLSSKLSRFLKGSGTPGLENLGYGVSGGTPHPTVYGQWLLYMWYVLKKFLFHVFTLKKQNKTDFTYLFLEGKGGRKRGRETSVCGCLLCAPYWDLACNPGMCPDQESNQRPFGSQACAQSTEPHQPGLFLVFSSVSVFCHIISVFPVKYLSIGCAIQIYLGNAFYSDTYLGIWNI